MVELVCAANVPNTVETIAVDVSFRQPAAVVLPAALDDPAQQ